MVTCWRLRVLIIMLASSNATARKLSSTWLLPAPALLLSSHLTLSSTRIHAPRLPTRMKHPDWVWACDFSFTPKRKVPVPDEPCFTVLLSRCGVCPRLLTGPVSVAVQRLATACLDGKVRIFDAANGRELLTINAHGDMTVNCVRLSPNGEQILSGSYDKVRPSRHSSSLFHSSAYDFDMRALCC